MQVQLRGIQVQLCAPARARPRSIDPLERAGPAHRPKPVGRWVTSRRPSPLTRLVALLTLFSQASIERTLATIHVGVDRVALVQDQLP